MKGIKEEVVQFLEKHNMYYKGIDPVFITRLFTEDMDKGLRGEESSLGMIPTYLKPHDEIPVGEKVIVLDAGGTNLRAASVSFDKDKKAVIDSFFKYPMPGTSGRLGFQEFYDELAKCVEPVINEAKKVGFCFSYPAEIHENRDGTIVKLCKEVDAPEVVGSEVCASLTYALKKRGIEEKQFVLLNDSAATLLTGISVNPHKEYDSYVGYILGTGTNSCYIEDQIINLESGWFDKIPRGTFDKDLDEKTMDPGKYFLEKAVSGAYLGSLCTLALKGLVREGFITSAPPELTTQAVNEFLSEPEKALWVKEDEREYVYWLIEFLIERSALFSAINLAAVVLKSGKGESPLKPICIAADGSTFFKLKDFQKRVETHLSQILTGDNTRYYEIVKVDNAPVIGAAIAALMI